MKKYTCNICGKSYDNLCNYVVCVSKCGEEAKKNYELEQMNKELYKIKSTKAHYEQMLNDFKMKYPKEYELNFGVVASKDNPCSDCDEGCTCDGENCDCRIEHKCNGDGNCYSHKDSNVDVNSIEFSYTDNGKDKPKLSAMVNGTKVDDDSIEKLFSDPEVYHLAKLLGVL